MTTSTIHEIVEVRGDGAMTKPGTRVSPCANDCGTPSMPGFYLILRLAADDSRTQCGRIRLFGPFVDRALAETLRTTAMHFGVLAARVP